MGGEGLGGVDGGLGAVRDGVAARVLLHPPLPLQLQARPHAADPVLHRHHLRGDSQPIPHRDVLSYEGCDSTSVSGPRGRWGSGGDTCTCTSASSRGGSEGGGKRLLGPFFRVCSAAAVSIGPSSGTASISSRGRKPLRGSGVSQLRSSGSGERGGGASCQETRVAGAKLSGARGSATTPGVGGEERQRTCGPKGANRQNLFDRTFPIGPSLDFRTLTRAIA
eukprot:311000-Prorocentrum_minimum.AAC.1